MTVRSLVVFATIGTAVTAFALVLAGDGDRPRAPARDRAASRTAAHGVSSSSPDEPRPSLEAPALQLPARVPLADSAAPADPMSLGAPARRDWHDGVEVSADAARAALDAALDDLRLTVESVVDGEAPHPGPRERRHLRTVAMRAYLDLSPHLAPDAQRWVYAEVVAELDRVDQLDGSHPEL